MTNTTNLTSTQTIHINTTHATNATTGSKYVPPHLRNRGGGASSSDGGNDSNNNNSSGRVGYGNRGGRGSDGGDRRGGGYGGDRRSDDGPPRDAPSGPPAATNSRWNNIEEGGDSRDSGRDYRSGGGGGGRGGGGYSGGRGGGGGGSYGRGGPRVNERGFHGDMRADPRLEKQLFDREDKQVTGINFDNYDDIPVETTGNDIPEPIDTYSIETIGPELMNNTQLCGYTRPTPVQKYSVPIGVAGRDLMACAQTGSG